MVKRLLDVSQTVEIVEDSEPEREENRKRRKEERRRRKEQLKAIEVIELTDSDSRDSVTLDTPLSPLAANSDNAIRHASSHDTSIYAETSIPQLTCTVETSTIAVPDTQSQTPTDIESGASDVEVEERTHRMRTKIGSFAFSVSSQTSSIAGDSSGTAQRTVHTMETSKGALSRQSSIKAAALYLDFSERQLTSLLKCVSCDLKWTIRKSAANKVAHMRTCAKKARITEETMKTLILREINAEVKKTGATVSPLEPPSKTYLEHVVKENIVSRPTKRQKELSSTVKVVSESCDDIRDRAKAIIDRRAFGLSSGRNSETTGPPQSSLGPPAGLAFACSDVDEVGPPPTQPIPGSKLGTTTHASRSAPRTLDLIAEPPSPDPPPEAQLIDDSKLPSARRSGLACMNFDLAADVVSPDPTSSLMSCDAQNDTDTGYGEDDYYLYDSNDSDDANDDAVLVFDPEIQEVGDTRAHNQVPRYNGHVNASSSSTMTPTAKSRTRLDSDLTTTDIISEIERLNLVESPNEPDNTPSAQKRISKKTSSPKKRNAKQKKNQNKDTDNNGPVINDEELFEKFRSMILEDETLYLRVLRYEPIRLDVFMDIAQEHVKEYDLGSLGLKIKLRAFLDRQAIHYCEPGGWGRR